MPQEIRECYRVEKIIKRSRWGTVSLVWDTRTMERRIYRDFVGSGEAYRRMLEVESPFLPRIMAVDEEDGHTFVLEEYIAGDTLADILRGGPLPQDQSRRIIMQLCRALETLHAIGVVHRDIKPENVILRGEDAVLIDFDVSRLCKEDQNTDTQMMGTAGYAAPEQYGFAQSDARADIYAIGVLLNEMLVLQHPAKQLAEGPFLPVISKCIEVNVDRRYSSAAELLSALEQIAQRKKGHVRRRGAAAAAAVCILAGLLYYGISRSDPPSSGEGAGEQPPAESSAVHDALSWIDRCGTAFRYDLDGDGIQEEYVFCVVIDEDLMDPYVWDDTVTMSEDGMPGRNPFPCVLRYREDGILESAEEFRALLKNVELTIRCETDPEASLFVQTPAEGWPGKQRIIFQMGHYGTWKYEASAVLGDLSLSAFATTSISRLPQ